MQMVGCFPKNDGKGSQIDLNENNIVAAMSLLQSRINEIIDVYKCIQSAAEEEEIKENIEEEVFDIGKRRKVEEHLNQINEAFLNQQDEELITRNIDEVREKIHQVIHSIAPMNQRRISQ